MKKENICEFLEKESIDSKTVDPGKCKKLYEMFRKKVQKINLITIGTLFGLLSYLSLIFPIYTTKIVGMGGYDLIIRGYNFMEFSVWGNLLMIIPLVLIAFLFVTRKIN